ncbi:MAG: glycosyltransferase [Candidatus Omnitrophica bacterium]|nr:glycosyltransferase [Candidatus Omnitrophota bacterium]
MPRVSIVIPTYNRANLLAETLESVFSQTYTDYEVIIVDDGSTDKTGETVDGFIKRFPGKIVYTAQENQGAARTLNNGIRKARGEYAALLDSDDIWLPHKLERCMDFLDTHGFDWVTSAVIRREEHNARGDSGVHTEVRRVPREFLDERGIEIHQLRNGLYFFSSVLIIPSGVVIKKGAFDTVGLFGTDMRISYDTDMWLRFEEHGLRGGYIDEPLFIYRLNLSSMTKQKTTIVLKDHIYLVDKHARILGKDNPVIRKTHSDFLWRLSDLFFAAGAPGMSLKCYLKAWYLYPEWRKVHKTLEIVLKIMRKGANYGDE